ncbi:MAG TPA: excisionase [Burkholderiaceae bacterium]|nr:excisionase [Burkholderiaceae bacterium]
MNVHAIDTEQAAPLAKYITVKLAAAVYGMTEKAIRRRMEEGVWLEGREWRRAPDGRLYVIPRGVDAWIERGGKTTRARAHPPKEGSIPA